MAATKTTAVFLWTVPYHTTFVDCSALVAAFPEDITHGGPTGCSPDFVTHEVRVGATSADPVFVKHISASDSASGGTSRVIFDTVAGGDLSGASVRVFFHFKPASSGGLTNVG